MLVVPKMSTASKVTLALSCVSAAGAFIFINWLQRQERDGLRQGPIKDAARIRAKREFTEKQRINELDHIQQAQLKQQFEVTQPLTGEVITGAAHDLDR